MEIRTTIRFDRSYIKLPSAIKRKAEARESIFKTNPFDPRLNTHKLQGKRKNEWAYSVDYSYRIAFIFVSGTEILYLDIGTHDELY